MCDTQALRCEIKAQKSEKEAHRTEGASMPKMTAEQASAGFIATLNSYQEIQVDSFQPDERFEHVP